MSMPTRKHRSAFLGSIARAVSAMDGKPKRHPHSPHYNYTCAAGDMDVYVRQTEFADALTQEPYFIGRRDAEQLSGEFGRINVRKNTKGTVLLYSRHGAYGALYIQGNPDKSDMKDDAKRLRDAVEFMAGRQSAESV